MKAGGELRHAGTSAHCDGLACPRASQTSPRSRRTVPAIGLSRRGTPLSDWDVNLMCIDAGQHFAVLSRTDEALFDRRYNIGAWAWELQRFPARWYDRFAYYDEIWVGTSFIASAIAPISPIPVIRIPPVMAPAMGGAVVADQVGWRRRPMSSCSCSCSTCTATLRARTRWRSSRRFDARSVHPSRFA